MKHRALSTERSSSRLSVGERRQQPRSQRWSRRSRLRRSRQIYVFIAVVSQIIDMPLTAIVCCGEVEGGLCAALAGKMVAVGRWGRWMISGGHGGDRQWWHPYWSARRCVSDDSFLPGEGEAGVEGWSEQERGQGGPWSETRRMSREVSRVGGDVVGETLIYTGQSSNVQTYR